MAKFFSLLVSRPLVPAPNGSRVRVQHALRYDERGNKYLAEVGLIDQYTNIQSFAASCDVNEIIRRATPEQMEAFRGGVYADTTVLPKTLADSYELLHNAELVFTHLDPEVKKLYKNYKEFLNSFGNVEGVAQFLSKMTDQTDAAAKSDTALSTKTDESEV